MFTSNQRIWYHFDTIGVAKYVLHNCEFIFVEYEIKWGE